MLTCEEVRAVRDGEEDGRLVLHEAPDSDRRPVLGGLAGYGYTVTCKPHPIVGLGDEPAVRWQDLADILG